MPVVVEQVETTTQNFNSGSFSADKPSGTTSGDLLVAFVSSARNNFANHVSSDGFTQVGTVTQGGLMSCSVWYRQAGGSEPSTYQWTHGASGSTWIVAIARLSGHDTTSPINVAGQDLGTSSTPASPSVTTTVSGCLLLHWLVVAGAAGVTSPPLGELWNDGVSNQEQTGRGATQGAAGATGPFGWSLSESRGFHSRTIAIAPAAGGGGAVIDESFSLDLETAALPAANVTAGGAINLAAGAGVANAGPASANGTLGLSAAAGISNSGSALASDVIALPLASSIVQAANHTAAGAVSLSLATAALVASGVSIEESIAAVLRAAASLGGIAMADSSVSAALRSSAGFSTGTTTDETITAAMVAGATTGGNVTARASLAAAIVTAIQAGANATVRELVALALTGLLPVDGAELNIEGNGLLNDLVSYWKLDEESGTRFDSHGINHLADSGDVASSAGKIGDAASMLASEGDRLTISDNESLSMGAGAQWTIAAWVYATALSSNPIVSKGVSGGGEYLLDAQSNGSIRLFAGSHKLTSPAGAIVTENWRQVVAWYDGLTYRLTVNNGSPVSSGSGDSPDGVGDFIIGGRQDSLALGWNGLIDEVGIWKRVLTADERAALYNEGAGKPYSEFRYSFSEAVALALAADLSYASQVEIAEQVAAALTAGIEAQASAIARASLPLNASGELVAAQSAIITAALTASVAATLSHAATDNNVPSIIRLVAEMLSAPRIEGQSLASPAVTGGSISAPRATGESLET